MFLGGRRRLDGKLAMRAHVVLSRTALWSSPQHHGFLFPWPRSTGGMLVSTQLVRTNAVGKTKSETTGTALAPRQCSTCLQVKDSKKFHREPQDPFEFKQECKDCVQSNAEQPIPEDMGLSDEEQVIVQKERGKQAMRKAGKEQEAFHMSMQSLKWTAADSGEEVAIHTAQRLHDPRFYEERLQGIATVTNLSREGAIEVLGIEPGLLLLPTDLLANRLAELRQAVPFGDVTELIYADPSLLLLDNIHELAKPVLRKLKPILDSEEIDYLDLSEITCTMREGGKKKYT